LQLRCTVSNRDIVPLNSGYVSSVERLPVERLLMLVEYGSMRKLTIPEYICALLSFSPTMYS